MWSPGARSTPGTPIDIDVVMRGSRVRTTDRSVGRARRKGRARRGREARRVWDATRTRAARPRPAWTACEPALVPSRRELPVDGDRPVPGGQHRVEVELGDVVR